MSLINIQTICDYVVLISAVLIATSNIYKFFKKPVDKASLALKKEVIQDLEEVLPKYLEEQDKKLKAQIESTQKQCVEEAAKKASNINNDLLLEIKEINLEQTKSINVMNESLKDLLRQQIMGIYYKFEDKKSLPRSARRRLDTLYKDYRAQDGNSYITEYYEEMCRWEIYEDGKIV